MTTTLDSLGSGQYALVTTFRRDGRSVPTAVWVVRDGDTLAIWTPTNTGKVKRIRNNPSVLVAPCDLRGKPLGEAVPARATIMDAAGTQRVRQLLGKKYGVLGWLSVWGSLVRRGRAGTVGIQIALT